MFSISEQVHVPAQRYNGEVVAIRQNEDGSTDYLVRYIAPLGRRPFYEAWWPEAHLAALKEK